MKSDKIRYLKRIVDHLNPNELEVLREYLSCFDTRGGSYVPKTLLLLEHLIENDELDVIIRKLPKVLETKSEAAIRMVAHRLKEKIGESILLDINVGRDDAYDDTRRHKIEVSKKILLSEVYRSRGLLHEVDQLYSRGITIAKKFELYDQLIEILNYRQGLTGLQHGREKFDAFEEEIQFYEACRSAAQYARKVYYKIILSYGFKGLNRRKTDHEFVDFLTEELETLQEKFDHTSSATVGHYMYMMRIELAQNKNDFTTASEWCLRHVELMKNNPSIYQRNRMGAAYQNLSQNEIYNYYFDYALGFAKESQKFYSSGSPNYALGVELEFYANFYAGNIADAESCLERITKSGDIEQWEFRKAWRQYLLACTNFVQGQYKSATNLLNETKALNKDKSGWNLGVRLLSIMNAIEQDQLDYADNLIVSMQQFMKQALKGTAIRKRDEVILKLLLELRRQGYDFENALAKQPELMTQLQSDDEELSWLINSPELIAFHQWFESKLKQTEFKPVYSKESLFAEA